MKNIRFLILLLVTTMSFMRALGTEHPANSTNLFQLRIKYNLALPGDTLMLNIGMTSVNKRSKRMFFATPDKQGIFIFKVQTMSKCGYLNIVKKRKTRRNDDGFILYNYFWERGDNIYLNAVENTEVNLIQKLKFSGKGATKYSVERDVRLMDDRPLPEERRPNTFARSLTDSIYWFKKSRVDKRLSILNSKKDSLTHLAYEVFKTNILMSDLWGPMSVLSYQRGSKGFDTLSNKTELATYLKGKLLPMPTFGISDEGRSNSINYVNFYENYFLINYSLENNNNGVENIFKKIISLSDKMVQQALLVMIINDIGYSDKQRDEYLALHNVITDPAYRNEFDVLLRHSAISLGDFTFIDVNKKVVKLEDFKGKLLYVDTWFSGCGGCIGYYRTVVSKIQEKYKDNEKFKVISISSDTDYNKWMAAVRSGLYTKEGDLNLYTGYTGKDHPMYRALGVFGSPTFILISPEGNIIEYDTDELRDLTRLEARIDREIK